jgi:sigma-E factor negative regulatory protein RseA
MKQETMSDYEVVSALADGQLRGDDFVRAVHLLEASAEHRSTWHAYHAVGDVMRTGACQSMDKDSEFLQRLRLNLAQERLPIETQEIPLVGTPEKLTESHANAVPASNDSSFRWKAWGGVFSVIAVSAVAWQMFTGVENTRGLAQVTPSTMPSPVVGQNQPRELAAVENQAAMISDPRLDALLAAHQQLGGTSAFQNPTGFVRSATFTGADR